MKIDNYFDIGEGSYDASPNLGTSLAASLGIGMAVQVARRQASPSQDAHLDARPPVESEQMSNRRNRRRFGQRVRSEASRDPSRATKAQAAFLASLPAERARKEQERYWHKPTKLERMEREKRVRRWRLGKPRKIRKRRTNVKAWTPGHDLDN